MTAITAEDCNYVRHGIEEYIANAKQWRGTARELTNILGLKMNENTLSRILTKIQEDLSHVDISIAKKRMKSGRIIVLTKGDANGILRGVAKTLTKNPQITLSDAISLGTAIQTSCKKGDAKYEAFEAPVTFPWKWEYGEIYELPPTQKEQINRVHNNYRKRYQRHCDLCPSQGAIEYRKMSDGCSSLVCKSCAEDYVRKARRLEEKLGLKNLRR